MTSSTAPAGTAGRGTSSLTASCGSALAGRLVNRPDGLGSLNGYVGVGRTHPFFEVEYSSVEGFEGAPLANIEVHGGLTYSGIDPDGRGPYEGTWWFGFDCVHWRDLAPYRTKPEYRSLQLAAVTS